MGTPATLLRTKTYRWYIYFCDASCSAATVFIQRVNLLSRWTHIHFCYLFIQAQLNHFYLVYDFSVYCHAESIKFNSIQGKCQSKRKFQVEISRFHTML